MPAAAIARLRLSDRELAVVEDRRREHGVGAPLHDAVDEIGERSHATRRDDRNIDRSTTARVSCEVEAGARAVAIHAGQQDFAGAARRDFARPRDGVEPVGVRPPWM